MTMAGWSGCWRKSAACWASYSAARSRRLCSIKYELGRLVAGFHIDCGVLLQQIGRLVRGEGLSLAEEAGWGAIDRKLREPMPIRRP